jgi:hypothetical protein
MADNKQDRGPRDGSRIDVNEDYELRYWTKELGVDEQTLKNTVRAVGPMADKVREHLRGGGPLKPSGGSGSAAGNA